MSIGFLNDFVLKQRVWVSKLVIMAMTCSIADTDRQA